MSHLVFHKHSYQHFDDLQLSAQDFYTKLEQTIKQYEYPAMKVKVSRQNLKEGGLFSSSREYLRITKDDHDFYVCAAPFGKSFFISWWLKEEESAASSFLAKIPIIGRLAGKTSKSYYQIDSELMFSQSINALVKTVIVNVTAEKGYTKPQMTELLN